MVRAARFLLCWTLAAICACAAGACTTKQPQPSTFFERAIAPTLQTSCVRTNTCAGGHVADVPHRIGNGGGEKNTGVAPSNLPQSLSCNDTVPSAQGFDPNSDPAPDFGTFQRVANPVLQASCAASNCHGTAVNALYLTCGKT